MDMQAKFESNISHEPNSGCWLWTEALNSSGYGSFDDDMAHRAAWRMFRGGIIPEGAQVMHKCDVRHCVNPDHLCIGNGSRNMRDSRDRGAGVYCQKLNMEDAEEIRRLYATGEYKQVDLARMFGIKQANVSSIIRKVTWLPQGVPTPPRSARHHLAKDRLDEIRRLYATGQYKQAELGKRFGVHQTAISNIVRRRP